MTEREERMTVRGIVRGLGNGEDVWFGRPGQHPNIRRCQIRSVSREEKQASRLFLASPRRPRKGDQTLFSDMFLKGRIFNLLD